MFSIIGVAADSHASIIKLRTGDKVEGIIIEKDDKNVVVDYKGAVLNYYTFEIESIDAKPIVSPEKKNPETSGPALVSIVSVEDYFRRGEVFYTKNNFEEAIINFTSALNIKKDNAEAFLKRGLAYFGEKRFDEALSDFNKAIEINPKYEEAYYIRGLYYANKNDTEHALVDYSKAIDINPEYIQAYLNRAFLSVNKGNLEEAISDADKVIKTNPNIAAVYYIRGLAFAKRGNFDEAIKSYGKAINISGDYVEAYINRALVYAYRKTADIEPSSPKLFINLGVPLNKEDLDKALSDCNKAIEISPKYIDAYYARAQVYLLRNEYKKSWDDVHKIEELGGKVDPKFLEQLKSAVGN